jgi:HD-GYP domain-containing protein (c-di-GMP phosphodiesterase class II)
MINPIDPSTIRPGMRFARPIFSRRGIKLLGAHITLTEELCDALHELALTTVNGRTTWNLLLAEGPAELAAAGLVTKVAAPRAGGSAQADYVTQHGVLAVAKGDDVQCIHERALAAGTFADTSTAECRRHRAARMRLADALVQDLKRVWADIPLTIKPAGTGLDLSQTDSAGWPTPRRLREFHGSRVERVRLVYAALLGGEPLTIDEPLRVVDDLLTLLVRYPTRFCELPLMPGRPADHLPAHAFASCGLAIAIAARMGWGEEDIAAAGLAAMLADVGMMLVPRRTLQSRSALSEDEINRVWRHPAYGVSLLSGVSGLPETIRRAVYQHHERENGGGYPEQVRMAKIGSLAKVVALADAFAAATEPRPYRPAKQPSRALQELVHLASERLFDRTAARALVRAVGLYPVGSCVKLSTGETARVVSSNAEQIDRPAVRVYKRCGAELVPGPEVDLAAFEPWALHVIAPAEDPLFSPLAARGIAVSA